MTSPTPDNAPWYSGISRYQWTVLVIASLGWVFDVFEGQIFVASSDEAMPSFIARDATASGVPLDAPTRDGLKSYYNNTAFAAFLLGGALGGIVFGMLSDRMGRKWTMNFTILFYSLFTCVSAFSAEWWQLAALRFFVAMGVGGEWAVASALVFEEFPKRARAHVGGIFHASSVFGTLLAVAATQLFIGNVAVQAWIIAQAESLGITDPVLAKSLPWRLGFAVGALPALLIIWIRASLKEPEEWVRGREQANAEQAGSVGSLSELFEAELRRKTLVGLALAAVGLATFWGVHVHGKTTMRLAGERILDAEQPLPVDPALLSQAQAMRAASLKTWDNLGMLLVTLGGGAGLLAFGPITQRWGRRPAFFGYHLGAILIAAVVFGWRLLSPESLTPGKLYLLLPAFGFLTLGMHAGYAIYFPELFPTHLRGTGSGFCFNGGRMVAAPILFLSGWLQRGTTIGSLTIAPIGLAKSCLLLSSLYVLGMLVLLAAPETRVTTDDAERPAT
jgi:MFS family permease